MKNKPRMIRELFKRRIEILATLLLLPELPALSVLLAYAVNLFWFTQTRLRLNKAALLGDKRVMQVGFILRYILLILIMMGAIRLGIFQSFVVSFLTYYAVSMFELLRGGRIWKKSE